MKRVKKTTVLLPFDEYKKLLEYIHDFSVIADRKDEKIISLDEIQKNIAL